MVRDACSTLVGDAVAIFSPRLLKQAANAFRIDLAPPALAENLDLAEAGIESVGGERRQLGAADTGVEKQVDDRQVVALKELSALAGAEQRDDRAVADYRDGLEAETTVYEQG